MKPLRPFALIAIALSVTAAPAIAQTVIIEEEAPSTTVVPAPAQDPVVVAPSQETTGSIAIPVERQTEIREIFVEAAPAPVTVDFDVSTGVVVPDTVTLQPLPPRVVEIVPEYQGYEYFALEDGRMVIVEPASSKVVYIAS